MTGLRRHFHTSIDSKAFVALSGLFLAGFVVVHMLGNLQIFEGPAALNAYAATLRDMPMLLWTVRVGLLGLFVTHLVVALRLAARNRAARPVAYAQRDYRCASLASRTMAISGAVLLLFVAFHLLHLTLGVVDVSYSERLDALGHRDVFAKVVHAFQQPWFALVYLAAQAVLGLHLSHAISSSFQTLGVEHPTFNPLIRGLGPAVAWVVMLGNVAIVSAVFFGLVRTSGGA